jgi:hypothetical protein
MNDRFAPGNVCYANNWANYKTGTGILSGDPRAIPMIITLTGAFAGSGGGALPVVDFATFYLTGWEGSPNTSSCTDPVTGNEAPPTGAGQGTLWGHFIEYVGDLGASTAGAPCDFSASSLSPCIPVMTQ